LRLNPDHANSYLNVGFNFLALNRRDEAKQVLQRALTRGLDTSFLHLALYQVAFLENDTKEMEAQVSALSSKGTPFGFGIQSGTEAYFGRLGNARGFSKRALEIAQRGNLNELAAQMQVVEALRDAEFGNFDLAKQAVARALTISSGRDAK